MVQLIDKCASQFRRRLPILEWSKKYQKSYVLQDAVAGITVGLTIIPQAIGYAVLVGLSPEYGLYSSYIGCLVYVLFGSCRQVSIGPSTMILLVVLQTCGSDFAQCSAWMSFYTGFFQLVMAAFNLGILVNFISEPVIIGYTSAAAVITITAQLRKLFGMAVKNGKGTVPTLVILANNLEKITPGDALMGFGGIAFLVMLQSLSTLVPKTASNLRSLRKVFWSISMLRNALVVLISVLIAWCLTSPTDYFKLTGPIVAGFGTIQFPGFTLPLRTEDLNGTVVMQELSILETWKKYGAGPPTAAVIAVMQNVAISKAFATSQSVDATQEMVALGVLNMVASFFGAFPTCGAISRSAVNEASGVRSTFGGFFTSLLVMATLVFLTPFFYYIPQATLAAVITAAIAPMFNFRALIYMWKIRKYDVLVCLTSFFFAIFFTLEIAIGSGVALNLLQLLVKTLKPKSNTHVCIDPVTSGKFLFVHLQSDVEYPGLDAFRTKVNEFLERNITIEHIIFDMDSWSCADYTTSTTLVQMWKDWRKRNINLIFYRCNKTWAKALRLNSTDDELAICGTEEELSLTLRGYNGGFDPIKFPLVVKSANDLKSYSETTFL